MPILLTVHSAQLAGAERLALAEARYLKRWFELVIAVPEGPLRQSFAVHGELVAGPPSLPLWGDSPRGWAVRTVRTVRDAIRLARLIRERDLRLVLTNSTVTLAPVLAARLAGVPAIVHARDVLRSRLTPAVFALEARLATSVIVVSRSLEGAFRRWGPVTYIPDGTEVPAVPDRATDLADPVRLCVLGTMEHRKGQDVALEALGRLRDRGVDASLELVGRGQEPAFVSRLRSRADDLGLSARVHLRGEVSDIDGVLDQSDIVIVPSRRDVTPGVLMEALARAKPVVASEVGGIPEVVQHGRTGLLVPPEDPDALASAVAKLVAEPGTALGMGARGREDIGERFDAGRALEALRAEVESLLAGSPA